MSTVVVLTVTTISIETLMFIFKTLFLFQQPFEKYQPVVTTLPKFCGVFTPTRSNDVKPLL